MTTRLTAAAEQEVRTYAATAPPMFRALLTAWLDERAALEAYESAMNGPDGGVREDTAHEAAKMAFDEAVRDAMPDVYELLLKCDALRRERDEAREMRDQHKALLEIANRGAASDRTLRECDEFLGNNEPGGASFNAAAGSPES